jgi:hypothetical protein
MVACDLSRMPSAIWLRAAFPVHRKRTRCLSRMNLFPLRMRDDDIFRSFG